MPPIISWLVWLILAVIAVNFTDLINDLEHELSGKEVHNRGEQEEQSKSRTSTRTSGKPQRATVGTRTAKRSGQRAKW